MNTESFSAGIQKLVTREGYTMWRAALLEQEAILRQLLQALVLFLAGESEPSKDARKVEPLHSIEQVHGMISLLGRGDIIWS